PSRKSGLVAWANVIGRCAPADRGCLARGSAAWPPGLLTRRCRGVAERACRRRSCRWSGGQVPHEPVAGRAARGGEPGPVGVEVTAGQDDQLLRLAGVLEGRG